jgi:hypothetical protein
MRLENFRRFEDTGDLTFSTVNFVFGKNSSGKTTLLRAPLLLKQLVSERSLVGGVPFSGPYVDFGSYPEAVLNSERSRDIRLTFDIRVNGRFRRYPRSIGRLVQEAGILRFEVTLHWNAKNGQAQYNSIHIADPRTGKSLVDLKRMGPDKIKLDVPEAGGSRVIKDGPELSLATLQGLPLGLDLEPEGRFNAGLAEMLVYFLMGVLGDAARSILHVGPLRDMPERAYRIDQLSTSGGSTEHVVGMLVNEPKAAQAVSRALRQLGIAKQVDVVQPAPGYAGVVLSDVDTSRRDNLADVGFGVSQVLPILVRLALAPEGSIVLIEQPELHLHPEVQGHLAEVMVDIALQRKICLFVESHSENMLLRLRRLVANGRIGPEAVNVLVTSMGEVKRAGVDERGRIDLNAFPAGFFEEEWEEAMGIIAGGGRFS